MSDNYIVLVPEDPRFVPDEERQRQAKDRLAEIAPDAAEIEAKVSSNIQFFDCGQNFQYVFCPACDTQLSEDWWRDRMGEDFAGEKWEDGVKLAVYRTPCCDHECNLNELRYDWPQRCGRFALSAMNPNIGELTEQYKQEFEAILGTKLIIIYQHI